MDGSIVAITRGDDPSGKLSNNLSSSAQSSGNNGTTRMPLPLCRSVFWLRTISRPSGKFTSRQSIRNASERLRPPKRQERSQFKRRRRVQNLRERLAIYEILGALCFCSPPMDGGHRVFLDNLVFDRPGEHALDRSRRVLVRRRRVLVADTVERVAHFCDREFSLRRLFIDLAKQDFDRSALHADDPGFRRRSSASK